jgi:hypothetical protein
MPAAASLAASSTTRCRGDPIAFDIAATSAV